MLTASVPVVDRDSFDNYEEKPSSPMINFSMHRHHSGHLSLSIEAERAEQSLFQMSFWGPSAPPWRAPFAIPDQIGIPRSGACTKCAALGGPLVPMSASQLALVFLVRAIRGVYSSTPSIVGQQLTTRCLLRRDETTGEGSRSRPPRPASAGRVALQRPYVPASLKILPS